MLSACWGAYVEIGQVAACLPYLSRFGARVVDSSIFL